MAIDAYMADTMHLSAEEHGCYLLLLMEAWNRPSCDLPDNDVVLARLARVTPSRWKRLKPTVMDFWHLDRRTRTWTQKRQRSTRQFVAQNRQQKRDAALSRWRKRKNPSAAACADADAAAMQSQSQSQSKYHIEVERDKYPSSEPSAGHLRVVGWDDGHG